MRVSRACVGYALAGAAITGALMIACGGPGASVVAPTPPPGSGQPFSPTTTTSMATAVLAGAGDIADCANDGGSHAEATAQLLDTIDGTVFTAGDNVYPAGTADLFASCYDPRWGRHKWRTRPAAGNHDYAAPGAAPYFAYFGDAAGLSGLGYYSYTLGAWHIVVLNSNIPATNGSAQLTWMLNDLAASRAYCTAVIWHHPLFSSGPSGGGAMADAFRAAYDQGVEIVINGHDHGYERFAPQDATGRADSAKGVREFVAASGGAPLYQVVRVAPNSEVRLTTYGILKLTLRPDGYDWTFIEAGTQAMRDVGAGACH